MKIFLAGLEQVPGCQNYFMDVNGKKVQLPLAYYLKDKLGVTFKRNLMSYYYLRTRLPLAEFIRDNSEEILIDSGAHSFQKGVHVDWVKYTKEYAEFIKKFDRPHIVGYFEMDVDNVIGYDRVLELRKILESVSNKIIPVWHKNRGIEEFKKMCRDYAGKVVAVTGFKNEDIQDHQYVMFLKYAKKYNCRVHCLGMTRKNLLDTVPFDYVDSTSWAQQGIYGRLLGGYKVSKETSKTNREAVHARNYISAMKMQDYYYKKWKNVSKD